MQHLAGHEHGTTVPNFVLPGDVVNTCTTRGTCVAIDTSTNKRSDAADTSPQRALAAVLAWLADARISEQASRFCVAVGARVTGVANAREPSDPDAQPGWGIGGRIDATTVAAGCGRALVHIYARRLALVGAVPDMGQLQGLSTRSASIRGGHPTVPTRAGNVASAANVHVHAIRGIVCGFH